MAETEKTKAAAPKAEASAEKEVAAEDATLERTTGQDFEVGSEEELDWRGVAAYAEREEAVEKLAAENAARVQ